MQNGNRESVTGRLILARIVKMHIIIRRYPRLLSFAASIVASYVLYALGYLDWIKGLHSGESAVAFILGGFLFSFGFTAAFGFAIFVELANTMSPITGALLGGVGSLIADMTILLFVQEHLLEELKMLKESWIMRMINGTLFHHRFPRWLRETILWTISIVIIASPLPDEIGVALVGSLERIDKRLFAFFCFVLNAVGIWVILMATRTG